MSGVVVLQDDVWCGGVTGGYVVWWCYRPMCGVVVLQADDSGVAVLQDDDSGVAVLQVVVTRTRGSCYLIPKPDGLNFASVAAEIASRNVSLPASTPPHFAFRIHTSLSASTLRFLHPHFALSIPVCFLHPHFASASTPRRKCSLMNW